MLEYPVTNYKKSVNRFDFSRLTKKETKEYFDWFISVRYQRINNLQNYVNLTSDNNIELDYSVNSLVSLWDWFEPWITFREVTQEELEKEINKTPEKLQETISKNTEILTEQTFTMLSDIAIYFAETMIKNHPKLYWDYFLKPIRLVHVKRPVVNGFLIDYGMDPIRVVQVLTLRSAKERDKFRLINMYRMRESEIAE